ncbi:MAG: aminotransferase class III-fold pyridoxal phosphate-dependent enzyme, partial [Alphaproteobacteria bacterium]|nr:aminotransferase class III-fold pyridoxal phosphate-dependent enzyme [Alphaproteobacteria bacterium]
LCIDGLQPEKGHETLYVVRELTRRRVWFAEPLLSATELEVRRLIVKAKEWAESLGMTVGLWMSDKQDAFVKSIAGEFPDVFSTPRGAGLLVALGCVVPNTEVQQAALAEGLLALTAGENVLRLAPPLIVSESEIAEALSMLHRAARRARPSQARVAAK